MIDFGFNSNLVQLNQEKLQKQNSQFNNQHIDKNSFFGSYLTICEEENEKYNTNPFFSEIPKPNISQTAHNMEHFNPNYSFFGAFVNKGSEYMMGVPPLKYNLNSNGKFFEEEYEKFLKKYPNDIIDYAFNNKLTYEKENKKKEKINKQNKESKLYNNIAINDIFPLTYLTNGLEPNNIYTTGQIIKKENKNLYTSSNILDETCHMNLYKTVNFDLALQKEFSTLLSHLSLPINQKDFYNDLIYLIQGIPSKIFSVGKRFPFTFEISEEYKDIRLISTLPELTHNFLNEFIDIGTKMQLIQYLLKNVLFKINDNYTIPFVLKRFYSMVNDIMIQLTEKIIYYKKLLLNNKITFIGLYNKINTFKPIINIIYALFNFPNEKNYEYQSSIENYYSFYLTVNLYQKSHMLINSLLNIYYSLNSKEKTYILIKNLLLNSLHSYLFFILHLLFTGDVIDAQREYFILQSNDNIALDSTKVPVFLGLYKSVLLNNTILINYIKKYDQNFYSVLAYQLSELAQYVDKVDMGKITTEGVDEFIIFKEKIYDKKVELMLSVNEKIINLTELERNKEKIERINKIKVIRDFISEQEKKELMMKEEIKKKKRKLYEDIQEQILNKKRKIENEILKIKNEKIAQAELEKEKESFKKEIIMLLKKKYDKLRQESADIAIYGDLKTKWKIMRNNNKTKRDEIFNAMFDENLFDTVYPRIEIGKSTIESNYHSINRLISTEAEEKKTLSKQESVIDNTKKEEDKKETIESKETIVKPEDIKMEIINDNKKENNDDIEMKEVLKVNDISVKIEEQKIDVKDAPTPLHFNNTEDKNKISFPKFFISNIIYNDILLPIIETSLELATEKIKKETKKKKKMVKFTSHAKTSKQVDNEVSEILNKINVLLQENVPDNGDKNEIPVQTIIQEFFYDIIIKQYKITNHSFVLMLKNKFHLLSYFDLFNQIFLCNRGDLNLHFIESIFDFRTLSLNKNDTEYLSYQIKQVIEKNYSLINSNFDSKIIESFLSSFYLSKISQLNLNFSISNLDISFELNYKAKEPLDIIFNNANIPLYDTLFKKLLKLNIYNQIISRTYSVIKNNRNGEISDNIQFKKITKLFNDCYRTLKSIQTFIYHEVIDLNWGKMKKKIKHSADVFDIIQIHNETIQIIHDILCNHPFTVLYEKLYSNMAQFYLKAIIIDFFDFNMVKDDKVFIGVLNGMKKSHNKIMQYLKDEYVIGDYYNLKKYL